MEISIISKEVIKPSSISSIRNKNPFKISLLDQLTPATYAPIILFFPSKHNTISSTRLLKSSLSKALTHLYPFSGRLKNNFSIHDFEQGIPYVETRVSCKMSDFLQQPQLDSLNHFLARRPYSHEFNIDTLPHLAVQVNVFDCGAMAISVSVFHKIFDGSTASFFLNSWAAVARGSNIHIDSHVLEAASSLYPPRDILPQFYEEFWDTIWFNKSNLKTSRFVFSEQAISTLRAEARSEHVEYPTRVEALSSFIWKSAMSVSRMISNSPPELSMLAQVVNLRLRAKQRLSSGSIGNIFLQAVATCCNQEISSLPKLVQLVRESVKKIDSKYVKSLQGCDGVGVMGEDMKKLYQIFVNEKPDMYFFTDWLKFGYEKVDFGWGAPIWVGVLGEVGPEFTNLTVFQKWNGNNNKIEAWITLEENIMGILEQDQEFLSFATLNPQILIT